MGRPKTDPVARTLATPPYPHNVKLPPDVVAAIRKEMRSRAIAGIPATFTRTLVAALRRAYSLPELTYNQKTGKYTSVPQPVLGTLNAPRETLE